MTVYANNQQTLRLLHFVINWFVALCGSDTRLGWNKQARVVSTMPFIKALIGVGHGIW